MCAGLICKAKHFAKEAAAVVRFVWIMPRCGTGGRWGEGGDEVSEYNT